MEAPVGVLVHHVGKPLPEAFLRNRKHNHLGRHLFQKGRAPMLPAYVQKLTADADRLASRPEDGLPSRRNAAAFGHESTGRNAAHKRMVQTPPSAGTRPVDLQGRAIHDVGPVDFVKDEVIGPAGPMTSTRRSGSPFSS